MKTKLKPPDQTGTLIEVEWGHAIEALLSWATTERSIEVSARKIEQAAAQHEVQAASARQGVVEMCEKVPGLPDPYKVGLRWDFKEKAIYRMPEEKK